MSGIYEFLAQDRVIFGRPAHEAVLEMADKLGKQRLMIVASKTLSRKTDVISTVTDALGRRCVGVFDECVEHVPRESVLALADEACHQRMLAGQPVPPLVVALLDARMDELYVAVYAHGPQGLTAVPAAPPRLCRPDDLAAWLQQVLPAGPSLAAGGGLLAGNVFTTYGERLAAVPGERQHALPTAAALLRLAPALLAAGAAVPAHAALPLYVRDKVAQTTAEREAAA
jgi:predicted RecB family endonuclease